MASQSSGDVEILVHVTARSRVSDDATYRRLAEAYLSFAPGSRAHVTIPSSPEPQQPPPSRQYEHDEGGSAVLQSFCSDSQDLSFHGALDNRNSPRVVAARTSPTTPPPHVLRDENPTTPTTAVHQLPSQIADSYPMPDCDLFIMTPTRVLQRYMGSRQPAPVSSAPPPASLPALVCDGDGNGDEPKRFKVEDEAVDVCQSSSIPPSDSSGTHESREKRQATIPVTPLVSEASRKRRAPDHEDDHDTSALDVTHISSSIPGSSASSVVGLLRAESDPLPSKRLRQLAQDAGTVPLVRSASDNSHQPVPPPRNTPLPSSSLSYNALSQIPSTHPSSSSLSVRPPSPPVGVDDLDLASLVAPKFAKLAHDLGSRYRPTFHRGGDGALDPLERGHWRVDCQHWPPALRAAAWDFLTKYVRSGLAGWGVWCRRSPDGATIKLYGWAHVVKHTYLLLYLASDRYIKSTGAQWFDAEGLVALEVLP
ncbi:hypothetical protein A9K55_007881 [Cordyceps militaris]|uniref:Uncharacterized protein n=1 Tax=Cordyceps militaris TaxID=73501 RepID=A0A2H4SGK2_CORMI|nr:hypothetical protein A9K55_007881 [Cordyceps militaris]